MSPEFNQKVRQILDEALDLPKAKRSRFLDFACADAPDVKAEVTRQLSARGELEGATSQMTADVSHPAPAKATPVGPAAAAAQVRKINRYEIKGELGRGAMGAVYEATDPVIGRTVALKVLHSNQADEAEAKSMEDRLFREASSAGRLAHPGIVTVFDVGKEGEMAFIAMERVEGPTLQQMMKGGKIDRQQILEILRQAAAALDYAHGEGIIHRDIKPANIMLHKGVQAKIADFGIAKVSAMSQLTVAGTILGTPSYMSPEQIQNFTLTGRSDQFSLAVVSYEMLTGTRPFERDMVAALLLAIVNGERPQASKADPTLPPMVDEVFQMALNKSPEGRFASCTAFIFALASAAGIELAATGSGTGVQTGSHPPSRQTDPYPGPPPTQPSQTGPWMAPPPPPPPGLGGAQFGAPPLGAALGATQVLPAMEPKKPPVGLYVGGGLLVVLLAAAYPVYKLIAPKQVAEVKPSEPKKIDVAEPPVEPKPSLPETNNDPKPEVGLPIPEEKTPPAEPEKKAPAPTKNPGGSVTPGKPPAEPAKPSSEPKPSNSAQAEKLYEEGMAKHRGQPGSAAIPSFEQAAALGEPRAMLELGKIYSAGDGVPKDPAKAAGWYRKSADLGNASAMVFLAAFYVQGTGVAKDPAEAVRWLRKAADSGNAVAMDGLGQMYASGQGVPADAAQAVVWYRKAVDGNNAQAMYHLGLLLESGSGSVAKNPAEAAQLFQRAANAGYAPAKAKLAASGPLTLTGLDKGSLAENKSQLYRLQGSGFSASTSVSSTAFSSIGSRDGQYDHHPTAVAPDGSWLAIYMSLPPQQGRNSVRLTVQNPGGASASLDVPVQH